MDGQKHAPDHILGDDAMLLSVRSDHRRQTGTPWRRADRMRHSRGLLHRIDGAAFMGTDCVPAAHPGSDLSAWLRHDRFDERSVVATVDVGLRAYTGCHSPGVHCPDRGSSCHLSWT